MKNLEKQKTCSCCHRILPVNFFWKSKGSPDGFQGYCKECMKAKHAKYQKDHPEKMREYAKNHWNKYRKEKLNGDRIRMSKRQEFLDTLKTACAKCGESRVWVIQFHHIDPEQKKFGVGDGSNCHKSKDAVIQEVKKCVCLCANCHKEFHYLYGQKPLNPVEDMNQYLNGGDGA